QLFTEGSISRNKVGMWYAGQIERFTQTGCHEDPVSFFHQFNHRHKCTLWSDKVHMDFITDQENIVGHADFPDFTQFFLRPNLSCRIMRITVNVDFYIILLAQCFKMVEIERVAIFIFYEWTVYNFPLIALQLANEGIVAWCRKDYPITFFGMLSDDFPDCKEHRWCIRNFLFLEFNTETGF